MPKGNSRLNQWAPTLAKFGALIIVLVFFNLIIVFLFGPQIWHQAGYFFGGDARTTLCTLMFIEGGVFLVFGSMWASGPMDNVWYGRTQKSSGSITKEDWVQRKKLTEKPNEVIRVSLLTGGVLLVASIVLFLT